MGQHDHLRRKPLPWRPDERPQGQFPVLPEPDASARCDRCTWAFHRGTMRLKLISASCGTHGRYLDGEP